MGCEPVPTIASSFAESMSAGTWSFAVNLSPKRRRMRAWTFSNASRYNYRVQVNVENVGDKKYYLYATATTTSRRRHCGLTALACTRMSTA
jgi:outer membrane receptor protein involved in Fe transport